MAWLEGFSNRLKLIVSSDNVDSNLTDFPVMVYLSSDSGKNSFDATAVFDELSYDNRKRIAITKSDGTTQCPIEIEYWDNTEEKAVLWTKIPTVYSSVDTDLYFYYDATYSGTTASGNTGYVAEITDTTYEIVMDKNIEGTYDTHRVGFPFLIKESITSYKMWYAGYDNSHWRIMYAISTDGISWTGHQMVINIGDEGTYDTSHVYDPFVIKESNTSYKMWYAATDGSHWRILYATSTDGINWSNFQMVLNYNVEGTYDSNSVLAPCIIKESSNSYKIWYSGWDLSNYRIMYATSTNGTSWSNHQMIIGLSSEGTYDTLYVFAPHVIKESDTFYRMWYSGADGSSDWRTIYCTSTNGITWGNFEMVIDINTIGTYDTDRAYANFVFEDDLNTMWYTISDGTYYRIVRATYWQNPVYDVWDDNFVGVFHMAQSPTDTVRNSTSVEIHTSVSGSMNVNDLVDGKIGKAIDFDGINDFLYTPSADDAFNITDTLTLEAIFKPSYTLDSGLSYSVGLITRQHHPNSNQDTYAFLVDNTGKILIGSYGGNIQSTTASWADSSWHYVAGTYDSNGLVGDLFNNGVKEILTVNSYDAMAGATNSFTIGAHRPADGQVFPGIIDEVRVSDTVRSDAWIKATYYSNWDDLITFQQEDITASWLSDWSKRIKLTIDHTKIDNTLVDFPVNITLVSGTGINNKDVTHIFDTLTSSGTVNFEDDFSTGLGEQWYDLSGTADYSSYYLKQTTDGAQAQTVDHIQWGDIWEVTFRWKNHGGGSGNDQYHLYLNLYTGYHLRLYMRTYNSGDYWVQLIRNMGSDTTLHTNTDYNYYNERGNWFWVRMRRTLDNLKFKIWKDGDSEPSWAYDADVLDDTFATLGVIRSYSAGTSSAGVGLDDIVVTGNDSRNKKIAITTDDGTTQCPVEIERWSTTYNEAALWTKVPVIKPDEDTILYLYYDPSQPNNTTYIGDTGSSAAQNVWDDDFVGVWHMAQQPTTTIKDSTSNTNHVTSHGSMTASDLIDGQIGKALDFDGTDDYLTSSYNTNSFPTTAVTFEGIVKRSGTQNTWFTGYNSGDTERWEMYVTTKLRWYEHEGSNAFESTATITEDEWVQTFFVYDYNSTSLDYYINGSFDSSHTISRSLQSNANLSMGARPDGTSAGSNTYHYTGGVDEFRVSTTERSAAWAKATYYSNWNDLITYGSEQEQPTHYYDGYVKEQGNPVLRTVRLYDRATGELVDETTSAGSNGYYYLTTTVSGEHFIVAFDDDEGIEYNALILDKLLPRGIE